MDDEVKDDPPLERAPPRATDGVVRAYLDAVHLKQRYRRGWLRRGIPPERCESVAEHAFGVAWLALVLLDEHPGSGLDREHVLRLALLHDLGEVHAGDLIPADGVAEPDKRERERRSVERVLDGLGGAAGHLAAWREYAEGKSAEARFVRQVDRLEMALQSAAYELLGHGDLGEFRRSAAEGIDDPGLSALLDELERLLAAPR